MQDKRRRGKGGRREDGHYKRRLLGTCLGKGDSHGRKVNEKKENTEVTLG